MKAVFFDLDNTLYDYDRANEFAMEMLYQDVLKDVPTISSGDFKKIYEEAKNQVKMSLIGTAASHNRILYMQTLVEKLHKTVDTSRIFSYYHSYWDTFVEHVKPFDGVINCLESLKSQRIFVVVVTNLTAYVQMRKIDSMGLSQYIDFLVTSEESGFDKPHPASFLLALNKVKLLPKDVVVVGDSPTSDLAGAQFLNIPSIWYRFGKKVENFVEGEHKPMETIGNFEDLKKILENLI